MQWPIDVIFFFNIFQNFYFTFSYSGVERWCSGQSASVAIGVILIFLIFNIFKTFVYV